MKFSCAVILLIASLLLTANVLSQELMPEQQAKSALSFARRLVA
jgi:hypothetical protein